MRSLNANAGLWEAGRGGEIPPTKGAQATKAPPATEVGGSRGWGQQVDDAHRARDSGAGSQAAGPPRFQNGASKQPARGHSLKGQPDPGCLWTVGIGPG